MKKKQQQQKNSSRKYSINICYTKFIKHFDKEITVLMDFFNVLAHIKLGLFKNYQIFIVEGAIFFIADIWKLELLSHFALLLNVLGLPIKD